MPESSEVAPRSWLDGRPLDSPFAIPRGPLGVLAGVVMGRGNADEQRDAVVLLHPRPGERILEVGYGPGHLLGMLLTADAVVVGVDPSEQMRDRARRRHAAAVAAGRLDVRLGTAEATGLPPASVDAVVSVNTVVMWTGLDAGMHELYRVTRPGGRLVLGWHGGTAPSRLARRLALGEEALDKVLESLHRVWGGGQRHDLPHLVAFTSVRPG